MKVKVYKTLEMFINKIVFFTEKALNASSLVVGVIIIFTNEILISVSLPVANPVFFGIMKSLILAMNKK